MPVTDAPRRAGVREVDVRRALDVVVDPELDEPITDLGFVRSITVTRDGTVEVHLRLPTSFCSPNFAYLMTCDAKDALTGLPGVSRVVVELDDHHDSDLINRGVAADLGYRGTFAHEAENDLEELRATFRRKAHTAATERSLTALVRANPAFEEKDVGSVRLRDLPDVATTTALLRRRAALGLGSDPDSLVLVDHDGHGYSPQEVQLRLRMARSTRISIDGNAHFCRGLLRTRYPGSGADQTARPDGTDGTDGTGGTPGRTFIPLSDLKEHQS